MSGNISGIRTLTMYNNDIPLSEPTAMESIGESTAMGGVLVGGIKVPVMYGKVQNGCCILSEIPVPDGRCGSKITLFVLLL